ncbi:MAG: MFS transporter [Chlamydiota bacterium]
MSHRTTVKAIAPCFLGIFVDVFGLTLALPILISLLTTGDFLPSMITTHVRYAYLAAVIALYPIVMFFGASFMGDLSDMIGRKKVLMLCMLIFCGGFLLMAVSIEKKSLALLFLGRGLTGVAAASFATAMAAIADLSPTKKKATYMSIAIFFQSMGFVLGPLIAGIFSNAHFVSFFSLSLPLFLASGIALVAFIWFWVAFGKAFVKNMNKKIHPLRMIAVFVEAAKHPAIRLLVVAFLLHQIAIALFLQLVLIFFQNTYHYATFGIGMVYSFTGLWLGSGILIISRIVKYYHIEWIAVFSLIVLSFLMMMIAIVRIKWLSWALLCPIGVFGSVAWSAMLTSFSNAADASSQGWVMGLTGSIVALSLIVSGLSFNLIPDLGVMPMVGFGGVILLVSAWIVYYYCRHQNIPKQVETTKES